MSFFGDVWLGGFQAGGEFFLLFLDGEGLNGVLVVRFGKGGEGGKDEERGRRGGEAKSKEKR